MAVGDLQQARPRISLEPAPIRSVQPGGGLCMRLELAWGKLRRAWLRTFRPGYVRRMAELRRGDCPLCPHDIVDPRDLKLYRNVCGYWFRPEDDPFRWRDRLGLARVGLCEVLVFSLLFTVLLGLCGLGYWLGWWPWLCAGAAAIVLLLWAEVIWFFRDPERAIPEDPKVLASPADGTVTDLGEVDDPDFPGGRAFRVGIFLSIFDVHVNRGPRAGRVLRLVYYPGEFLNALNVASLRRNEQMWIDFEEPVTQRLVRVKQVAGAIARRIVCWLKPGDQLQAGDRIGMIKFGSRTEVYVPAGPDVRPLVKIGDKVKGGASVLLRFGE
jgi:phosphatidylserine decarboxylase